MAIAAGALNEVAAMIEPPSEQDREHARLILAHIKRLRELGEFAGTDTADAEEAFIAFMLRNERAGVVMMKPPRCQMKMKPGKSE